MTSRDGAAALACVTDGQLISEVYRRGLVSAGHSLSSVVIAERSTPTRLPTAWGTFLAIGYRFRDAEAEHLVLLAERTADSELLDSVRLSVHRECLIGDIVRATSCGCRDGLDRSLAALAEPRPTVLVYLRMTPISPEEGARQVFAILEDLNVMAIDVFDGKAISPTLMSIEEALRHANCGEASKRTGRPGQV